MSDNEHINYRTLPELLNYQLKHCPNLPFLLWKDTVITYQEFDVITNRVATALQKMGLGKGDVVSLYLPNCPEFIYLWFGLSKLGAVMGPINALFKGDEVKYIINDSEAKCIVTVPQMAGVITDIASDCPGLNHKILLDQVAPGGWLTFNQLINSGEDRLPGIGLEPDDIASIIYTSGTTGKPKGVLLSHWNYISDGAMTAELVPLGPGERIMMILPLFHVNAQIATTIVPMLIGGTVVILERFNPVNFWSAVEQYQPVSFSCVPTILSILLDAPGADTADYSSLRYVICGAAPLPVNLFHRFEEKFKLHILEGYGLTEGTCVSSINPYYGMRKIGSIGLPLRGQEMDILDEKGNILPVGELGEICIRGSNTMQGYFKKPEATAEIMTTNGWLRTGDIGLKDADGYFWIKDRKKEMIIRGGENIYPREIEEVLYTHPNIQEAAVIGVSDEKYGEEVKAVIVLRQNTTATATEIISFCQERLAKYKVPRHIEFRPELPKNPTGKILKKLL